MKEKIKEKIKGELKFKHIKDSKCPHCGSNVEDYSLSKYGKCEERVRFACGCVIRSTSTEFRETRMCGKSKEFKKLKNVRLKEFKKVESFVTENVKEEVLLKEIKERLKSIKYRITDGWL